MTFPCYMAIPTTFPQVINRNLWTVNPTFRAKMIKKESLLGRVFQISFGRSDDLLESLGAGPCFMDRFKIPNLIWIISKLVDQNIL